MHLIVDNYVTHKHPVAYDEYIVQHNTSLKPFIWIASARDILQKVIPANSRLSSKQNAALHQARI
ncbi:hypothetical protein NTGHW29_920033 [Candidatus Nitrotoga sp. HW29]|nr:hypothetical protein NTGHW29_920033 [Candidatus Nitrotoga sp. HW29]